MQRQRPALPLLLIALTLTVVAPLVLKIHRRTTALPPAALPRTFSTTMPATILWAWEEPEDLITIDPTTTGVAYLAESLTLTDHLVIRPRYQPLAVVSGTSVMAVVRIQPSATFKDSLILRAATVEALLKVARQPNLRALQIDFDASASQRPFYAAILHQLRPQMPPGMPISITALVSWCGSDSAASNWLATLPIDEAVPMFFRLGGHSKPHDSKLGYPLRNPSAAPATASPPTSPGPPSHPLSASISSPLTRGHQPNSPPSAPNVFRPSPASSPHESPTSHTPLYPPSSLDALRLPRPRPPLQSRRASGHLRPAIRPRRSVQNLCRRPPRSHPSHLPAQKSGYRLRLP